MAKVRMQVVGWECERCSHRWVPRDWVTVPRVCPKCKSPYWNKPRKNQVPSGEESPNGVEEGGSGSGATKATATAKRTK